MKHESIISLLLANQNAKPSIRDKIFYGPPDQAPDQAKLIIKPNNNTDFYSRLFSKKECDVIDIRDKILPESLTVNKHNGRLVCYQDIIKLSHFFLTRREEIVRGKMQDQHGRFPGKESLAYRAGFIGRPIVDEYGQIVRRWLREAGERIAEPPEQIKKIYLTHDVDIPFMFQNYKSFVKAFVKNSINNPAHAFDPLLGFMGFSGKDPLDCFDWIMDQDNRLKKKLGEDRVESIFFFISGGNTLHETNYDIRSRRIRRLIGRLQHKGATIGLHASYEAGMNPELVVDEADRLRSISGLAITKNRYHFLICREPEHMKFLSSAGITDDFSMGYADQAGFRLGTSRPFNWIDPTSQEETNLTIHPMTVMECTLDRKEYMGMDFPQALETCEDLVGKVKKNNGEAVLLWHNTELTKSKANRGSYQRRLYLDLLKWIGKNAG